jgi:hypothetical protein
MRRVLSISILLSALFVPGTTIAQEQVIAWKGVGTWAGSSDATTETFLIGSGVWRVRWEIEGFPGFVPRLIVWAHPSGGARSRAPIISHDSDGRGTVDLKNGPGRFALEVVATNGEWQLVVEELTNTDEFAQADVGMEEPRVARVQTASTQACLGNPARRGQSTIGGLASFTDGAVGFSGAFDHNARGPVAVGFGGSYTNIDNIEIDRYTAGGAVSIEALTVPVGICPVLGVTYVRFDTIEFQGDEINIDGWVFPIGVGIGGTIESQTGIRIMPFAIPQLQIIHANIDAEISDLFLGCAPCVFDESDTSTEFAVDFGITFAGDTVFGTVGVNLTSADESDPTVSVGGGFIF